MAIIRCYVLCNAAVVVGYDRRISELSSAPLDIEYDNNSIKQSTAIALNMNMIYQPSYQHIRHISTFIRTT